MHGLANSLARKVSRALEDIYFHIPETPALHHLAHPVFGARERTLTLILTQPVSDAVIHPESRRTRGLSVPRARWGDPRH